MENSNDNEQQDLQLLSPFHRIAFCSHKNPKHVQFSTKNVERMVKNTVEIRSEYESCSIGIICVLGSNEKGYRELYTDLLIHYFMKKQDKDAINFWQGRCKTDCSKLCYIGKPGLGHEESGLYIWPVPCLVQKNEVEKLMGKTFVRQMLLWVIFADGNNSQILDNICSLMSSNIVTFKASQNDKIKGFWKNQVTDNPRYITDSVAHLNLNSSGSLTTDTIKKTWDQLIKNIESKPIQTKKFQDSDLTLKMFVPFLDSLQGTISKTHECTIALELPMDVPNDQVHKAAVAKLFETSPEQTYPTLEEPIQAEQVEELSPGKAIEKMQVWIEKEMSISNVQTMMEDLALWNTRDEQNSLQTSLYKVHQVIQSFNTDLKNMFDNYVCFQGNRDSSQMLKFMETAYERAKQIYQNSSQVYSTDLGMNIFESVRDRLFALYKLENQQIVHEEEHCIQKVVEDTEATCKHTFELFIEKRKESDQDFETILKIMKTECIEILRRVLDYGGKLNNVLTEASNRMNDSLDGQLLNMLASNDLRTERSPPSSALKQPETTTIDPELENKKKDVLTTCDQMEAQLEQGIVQVGVITTKIITEAIKKCRLAANENILEGSEVKYVYELLIEHGFHIAH